MKPVSALFSLFALAAAHPAPPAIASTPSTLDVQLQKTGNTKVKAVVTNKGKSTLRILKAGSIFDGLPTDKFNVVDAKGTALPFKGFYVSVDTQHVNADSFQTLAAGKTVEVEYDLARTHDLSAGGDFHVASTGIMQLAHASEDKLVGSMPFASNKLQASGIDGTAAAHAREAAKSKSVDKRTYLQNDCGGSRGSAQTAANRGCAALASSGYYAATQAPDSKLQQYFKDASQQTRQHIQGIYSRAYDECNRTPGGGSNTYCSDVDGMCSQGIFAYTYYTGHYQVYCDLHYQYPTLAGCHYFDQASTGRETKLERNNAS